MMPMTFFRASHENLSNYAAIIHDYQRFTYRDFWLCSLKLASMFTTKGSGIGDTVTVILSETRQC